MKLTKREISEIFGMRKENIREYVQNFIDSTYAISAGQFIVRLSNLSNKINESIESIREIYDLMEEMTAAEEDEDEN